MSDRQGYCFFCRIYFSSSDEGMFSSSGTGWGCVNGELTYTTFTNYRCRNRVECEKRVDNKLKPKENRIIFLDQQQGAEVRYKTADGTIIDGSYICDYDESKGVDSGNYGFKHNDYHPGSMTCVGIFKNPTFVERIQPTLFGKRSVK